MRTSRRSTRYLDFLGEEVELQALEPQEVLESEVELLGLSAAAFFL